VVQPAKWIVIAFAGLLTTPVVMEVVDPEGMQKAREVNAQAAAERCLSAEVTTAEKDATRGADVVAGLMAIAMKNNGGLRPRGAVLEAWARKAADAMELPSDRRTAFVRDFERAFDLAWETSR